MQKNSLDAVCPLCGKPNNCLLAARAGSDSDGEGRGGGTDAQDGKACWCARVPVAARSLPLVPDVPGSCLCRECLEKRSRAKAAVLFEGDGSSNERKNILDA